MNATMKYKIDSQLKIRERCLDYASRTTPCLEVETEQVLKYHPDLTVEQAKDQASERLKGRKGAVIGELSQSVTVALDLYQDKQGERLKLTPDQKDLIAHVSRLVCTWLFLPPDEVFAPLSRTQLTPQMVNGLGRWMTEYRDGEYIQRATFRDELAWVIHWAKVAHDWTVAATNKGNKKLFADMLARYQTESIAGAGAQSEHWELHGLADYVAMKTQGHPPPNFPEPQLEAPLPNLIDNPSLETQATIVTPLEVILRQDECAPDALEYFCKDFEKIVGCQIADFKAQAIKVLTAGEVMQWHNQQYFLEISADYQFYTLYQMSAPQDLTTGNFFDF